jgi:hypothetical protein
MLRSAKRVSKHGAAPSFETRCYAPLLRMEAEREPRPLLEIYCRQEANASLNAFSPGVPFSIARMARRLLL